MPLFDMLSLRVLLLVCTIFCPIIAQRAQEGSRCDAPDGQTGKCLPWTKCEPLARLLRQRPVRKETVVYVQRFNCGYRSSMPFFCCVQEGPLPQPSVLIQPTPTSAVSQQSKGNSGWGNPLVTHPKRDLLPMDKCGTQFSDYIVGGEQANLGEFPWLALIQYRRANLEQFKCGGSLINNRYVLTAAHCLHDRKLRGFVPNMVRLGEHNTMSNPDIQMNTKKGQIITADPVLDFGVEQKIVHENYNAPSYNQHYDIGLIRLDRDVPVSTYVRPICLPSPEVDSQFTEDSRLEVAGWGGTETNIASFVKLKVEVPVVDTATCGNVYKKFKRYLNETQLCAGGESGRDSCGGDSGGPLMGTAQSSLHRGIRFFAVGIVSYGPSRCGSQNIPGVYTRVVAYVSWILDHMQP